MAESKEYIFIGVAWPYANAEQHLGHYAGAQLPPDIFARFHRMKGNHVLMISGSDTHGTPITIRADQEGTTPDKIVDQFHPGFISTFQKIGLTYDLFTHTDTQNHWDVTHDLFLTHQKKGYIYKDKQKQVYDPKAEKFLPDRYVEGECPFCGNDGARGDQCDKCGKTYDAVELKNPRSKITGNTDLEVRETEHFFLDLGKVNEPLLEWVKDGKDHWRSHVYNQTVTQLEERALRGRPITRDITWGITVPVEGYDTKRIYVWYDAVIGYLSGSKEWASLEGDQEAWKKWWDSDTNPDAKSYYFIGKDNIVFHTIIWPGQLIAYGGLNLPYDVPANEYLNFKGGKFSKSLGNIISMSSVLERYQPDAWRYALTAIGPETGDVTFSWDDFIDRVNGELVANWGNLVNRVMKFAYKRFDGKVPEPQEFSEKDLELLNEVKAGFESVGSHFNLVKLRAATRELLRLSQLVNQYITETEPFKLIKEDEKAAATVTFVAMQCIAWLNTLWAPILCHSAEKVHEMLGFEGPYFGRQWTENVKDDKGEHLVLRYDHSGAVGKWEPVELIPGHPLGDPQPLFEKLDKEKVFEAEGVEQAP